MPHYFFDVDDGERQTRDEAGICLSCVDDVEREARMLLQILSMPEVLKGRDRLFTAVVRDREGTAVYRATAMLKVTRPGDHR